MASGTSVKVFQTPESYKQALERHGQYVRWYNSFPCFCVSDNGQPDVSCTRCKGRGYIYYPLKEIRRVEKTVSFGGKIIKVEHIIKSINNVLKPNGNIVAVSSFDGVNITLDSTRIKGEYFVVDYQEELEMSYSGSATMENKIIVKAEFDPISDVNGDFYGEITEVTSLTNVTQDNSAIEVVSYWDNLISIDPTDEPAPTDVLSVVCKYVNPIIILVSGVSYKAFKGEVPHPFDTADMQASIDAYLNAGRGDMITLLKANIRGSFVGNYVTGDSDFYLAPFMHVEKILRLEDSTQEITDAVIVNNNEIVFTTEPDGKFGCSILYHPSFMVVEAPDPRFAENKVFPRKLALKRMDLFGRKSQSPRFDSEPIY